MEKIKLYIGYNEYTNTRYFNNFKIIDHIPQDGEEFRLNEEIVRVEELHLDCEQGNEEAYFYKPYRITLKPTDQPYDEDDDPSDYETIEYVAFKYYDENEAE